MTTKKYDQATYNKTWEEKNKDHSKYLKSRSSCKSFIRTKAKLEDLAELEELIKERRNYLQNDVE